MFEPEVCRQSPTTTRMAETRSDSTATITTSSGSQATPIAAECREVISPAGKKYSYRVETKEITTTEKKPTLLFRCAVPAHVDQQGQVQAIAFRVDWPTEVGLSCYDGSVFSAEQSFAHRMDILSVRNSTVHTVWQVEKQYLLTINEQLKE